MQAVDREQRRRRIVELVRSGPVQSQAALQERLAEEGCEVTQATLSRDLRDLGVVKAPDGYRLGGPAPALSDLERATRQWLLSATPAQNQVVLRTPPGCAQPLALALDGSGLEEIVGTLAGDDTVLVVTPDRPAARRLAHRLESGGRS